MRLSEHKCKAVINEKDEVVEDDKIEDDEKENIIIPGQMKLCNLFGKSEEYIIPFKCICQIGEDIVLVCIDTEKFTF